MSLHVCRKILSHVRVYSFIVFKYVNLTLMRERYILEIIGLYFGGEALLILGICEAR